MPDYFVKLAIPADTAEDAPVEKTVEVEGFRLEEVAYLIPPGWSALAHFAVFYGIRQIYPAEAGTWVTGDGLYRRVPLRWLLPESPCKLTLKGWNEDNTYSHTVYMWLLTKPEEEVLPIRLLTQVLGMVRDFLRRVVGVPT